MAEPFSLSGLASSFGSGLMTGAGGFGADLFSGLNAGTFLNQAFGKSQSHKARAFVREVMQHRYQWMVDDLVKAGLNPMLAVGKAGPGGGGAPIVGAAAHGGSAAQAGAIAKRIGQEVKTLESTMRAQNQSAATGVAQADLIRAQEYTEETVRRGLYHAETLHQAALAGKAAADTRGREMTTALDAAKLAGALTEEKIDKHVYGQVLRAIKRGVDTLSPLN